MSAAIPRPEPREIGRGPLLVDGALAVGLSALLTIGTYLESRHHPGTRPFDAGTVALLLVATGSLAGRRIHPVVVLGITFGATLAYNLLGYTSGPIWLALIIAYVTAILEGHRVAAAIAAVAGFGSFWLDPALHRGPSPSLISLAALTSWLLLLFGAADAVRFRRQRMAEAIRIREVEARRRAGEERLRIARDLHDVLAHNISVINVQAGVALHLHDDLPDQVRDALRAIRQASKDALGELRSVLDVLRQADDAAPRGPVPGLDRLDELLAGARSAGLTVHLDVRGERQGLQAGVDLAAYRILQEALTNVIRHAQAKDAWISVTYAPGDVTLRIEDDGRSAPRMAVSGDGNGIVGMRERAEALGGDFAAGPCLAGGFRVVARLPLEAVS